MATKTTDFFSECAGKPTFDTPRDAARALRSMKRRPHAGHRKVQSYRCSYCSKWHIGNPLTQSRKALRQLGDRYHRTHSPPA